MDFTREPYVRIFTRVTETTQQWGFFGRMLMDALICAADRSGIIELDPTLMTDDTGAAVASALRCPDPEWVREHLPKLMDHGAVKIKRNYLVVVRYHEAQYSGTHASTATLLSRKKKRDTERAVELKLIKPPAWWVAREKGAA